MFDLTSMVRVDLTKPVKKILESGVRHVGA
jgi:hypothetical protein